MQYQKMKIIREAIDIEKHVDWKRGFGEITIKHIKPRKSTQRRQLSDHRSD